MLPFAQNTNPRFIIFDQIDQFWRMLSWKTPVLTFIHGVDRRVGVKIMPSVMKSDAG
jgi:hypothetical protein